MRIRFVGIEPDSNYEVKTPRGLYVVRTSAQSLNEEQGFGPPIITYIVAVGKMSVWAPAPPRCQLSVDLPEGKAWTAWHDGFDVAESKETTREESDLGLIVAALFEAGAVEHAIDPVVSLDPFIRERRLWPIHEPGIVAVVDRHGAIVRVLSLNHISGAREIVYNDPRLTGRDPFAFFIHPWPGAPKNAAPDVVAQNRTERDTHARHYAKRFGAEFE